MFKSERPAADLKRLAIQLFRLPGSGLDSPELAARWAMDRAVSGMLRPQHLGAHFKNFPLPLF